MEFERSHFEFKPSAYGFRSIIPKSRADRRASKDKVLIEKGRIEQRTGWQAKLQRENAPKTSAGLTTLPEGSAGYISNMDRFHTDTAGEEYDQRMEALRREKEAIEYRKKQSEERDKVRWDREDAKKKSEEDYWERLRDTVMRQICFMRHFIIIRINILGREGEKEPVSSSV